MSQYKEAGVDIEAGYKSVELIKKHVSKTIIPGVLSGLGSFGSMVEIDVKKYPNPVLVSGTDGVGTKLKLAYYMDKHDTIGIDCVAMCVNDIICQGADPLYFLDYIAVDKNIPEKIEQIVKGIANGCMESECALVGGETAEMPGIYKPLEYDVAGFAVGVVNKQNIITGDKIKAGDAIIGITSSGVHSNGFSLIRKIFNLTDENNNILNNYYESLNKTLGEALLKPTKLYVKAFKKLKETIEIHGISHITGGGFIENIPRAIPCGLQANINLDSYKLPALFKLICKIGKLDIMEMYNIFNMGIGLVFIVSREDTKKSLSCLKAIGEEAILLGEIVEGKQGIKLC